MLHIGPNSGPPPPLSAGKAKCLTPLYIPTRRFASTYNLAASDAKQRKPHSVQYKDFNLPLVFSSDSLWHTPMRSFFRSFLRRRPLKTAPASTPPPQNQIATRAMSGGMTAAVIYAASVSSPKALGAVPEDSATKAHHAKDGKGFVNPWPSWVDFNPVTIGGTMIWFATFHPNKTILIQRVESKTHKKSKQNS